MKKKIFSLLIIAIMLMGSLFVFAGCGDDDDDETTSSSKKDKANTSAVNKYDDDDEDDKKSSSNKNKYDDDDEDDKKTSNNKNKYDDDDEDDKKSSSSANKITNTIGGSSSSKKNIVKIVATNSELSKSLGEVQGVSYGDIKLTMEYNKSTEEIVSAQISMSIKVTDKNMLTALEGMDLSTLFQSALSGQEYIKNAKTETVGNTINFYADMDIEAAMKESGNRTTSLEEIKEAMEESSFKVTIEE